MLGFHRLDGAVAAHQKNTDTIRLFLKCKPAPVNPQPQELLDEIVFVQPFECRDARDLGVGQPDLTRPATTGRATLAFVED